MYNKLGFYTILILTSIFASRCISNEDYNKTTDTSYLNTWEQSKDTGLSVATSNIKLLFGAIQKNDTSEIKRLVLSGCNINETISSGNTEDAPLRQAIQYCDTKMLTFLLENGADPNIEIYGNMTPTHYAAGFGSDKFELLIKYGGDINTVCCSCNSSTPFEWALRNDRLDNINIMLDNSYNLEPDSSNMYYSSLDAALRYENFQLIDLILDKGASPNLVFSIGFDDCYCACPEGINLIHHLTYLHPYSENKEQLIKLLAKLVSIGVDINAENHYSQTPIDNAACMGDTMMIDQLIKHGSKLGNALYYASLRSNFKTVEFLLKQGAYPNKTTDGNLPLITCITCCGDGFGEGISYSMRIKTIEALIKHGADLYMKDKTNTSFIDYVKSGLHSIYVYFINNGTLNWKDIDINFNGKFNKSKIVESDSLPVHMLPNLKSPILFYLRENDTILLKSGGYIITDIETDSSYLWKQLKLNNKTGFISTPYEK